MEKCLAATVIAIVLTCMSAHVAQKTNANTVLLTTTLQSDGTDYTVTVQNVVDTAAIPSAVNLAANTATLTSLIELTGVMRWEAFTGLSTIGVVISEMVNSPNFPANPNEVRILPGFEGPNAYADGYGARIVGFITPETTGSYVFFIATDENGELWLSSDETPDKAVLIATEPVWANARAWTGNEDGRRPGCDTGDCEPGLFTMGSPASEPGRFGDEGPQHDVRIGYPLWVGKCEVTQAQWEAVMGSNPSLFVGPADRPVESVTWEECQTFVQALNAIEDGGYRLLSEAEWEYACRAGTTTAFHGGQITLESGLDPVLDGLGWFWNNSSVMTHQVGQKRTNAWGLCDMHGNVWEWVEDDWHDSYCLLWVNFPPFGQVCVAPAPGDGSAWVNDPRSSTRVFRGGSWDNGARYCRSANRGWDTPGHRFGNLGFRLARQLPGALVR